MRTLTEYPKPVPRFGLAQISSSRWMPRGGWFQSEHGDWRRVWTSRRPGSLQARRAVVVHEGGWWVWRVEQFDARTRRVARICARSSRGHFSAAGCFPFADLAVRTAD